MYPSMQEVKTVEALDYAARKFCRPDPNNLNRDPDWLALARGATRLLFSHCFFSYDDAVYRQTRGIAMGTSATPNLANLYLAKLEDTILGDTPGLLLYRRFIDDGLLVTDSEATARAVLQRLRGSGLQLEEHVSQDRATFLDLEIAKGRLFAATGLLEFRTHRKVLNRYLYVPAFSAHHPASRRSWVVAELLRLRNTTPSVGQQQTPSS